MRQVVKDAARHFGRLRASSRLGVDVVLARLSFQKLRVLVGMLTASFESSSSRSGKTGAACANSGKTTSRTGRKGRARRHRRVNQKSIRSCSAAISGVHRVRQVGLTRGHGVTYVFHKTLGERVRGKGKGRTTNEVFHFL